MFRPALLALLCVAVAAQRAQAPADELQDWPGYQQILDRILMSDRIREEQLGDGGRVQKRRCLINAGLSQGCDLSDILMAKQLHSKFSSFSGPGKR